MLSDSQYHTKWMSQPYALVDFLFHGYFYLSLYCCWAYEEAALGFRLRMNPSFIGLIVALWLRSKKYQWSKRQIFFSFDISLPLNLLHLNLKYFSSSSWKTPPESLSPALLFLPLPTHPGNSDSAIGNWLTIWLLMREADGAENRMESNSLFIPGFGSEGLASREPEFNSWLSVWRKDRAVTEPCLQQPLLYRFPFSWSRPLKI